MEEAVIIDAVRSPMAKGRMATGERPGGALSLLHPVELLSQTVHALVDRNDIDPAEVDDILMGCVSQVGEQAGPVGRWAWLAAGFPESVPATTVDRRCGSSQQAVDFAAQGVMAGAYDMVIAGGVESMSRVPMLSARMDRDIYGPSTNRRYDRGLGSQGVAAELIAARWEIPRDEMDQFAAESHRRAAAAADSGEFDRELVPVQVGDEAGATVIERDETIRPDTTVARLAELKPAFRDDELRARYPEIRWSVTAGNSSQITDGASALLIMSASRASRLGLRPRARFRGFAVAGDDPIAMLSGPLPATEKVLARSGMALDAIDHYEVNEAFASVPLAWKRHFDADPERLNPRGGAIALGHPLGASGARLMTTMLGSLESSGGRYGLQTMCEAGGMANATLIERI